jgi:hypothetical protein
MGKGAGKARAFRFSNGCLSADHEKIFIATALHWCSVPGMNVNNSHDSGWINHFLNICGYSTPSVRFNWGRALRLEEAL